ncbi:MAG: zinc ribbon domain-containing protein [Deltaproteobacteria bacterium]|nr:zinc ribbon domain-containing protein [Deltaproteobacteria bacterium]
MKDSTDTIVCRKCGAPNPPGNDYCASCGAILLVSTGMMKAQPKPAVPLMHRFENRWLLMSVFAFLGVWVLSVVVFVVFARYFFDISLSEEQFGQTDIRTRFMPVLLPTLAAVTLMYFGAGWMISQLARDTKTAESVIGAVIVSVLVGSAGSMVSSDFLLASLLLGTPGIIAAGLGARFGGKKFERSS